MSERERKVRRDWRTSELVGQMRHQLDYIRDIQGTRFEMYRTARRAPMTRDSAFDSPGLGPERDADGFRAVANRFHLLRRLAMSLGQDSDALTFTTWQNDYQHSVAQWLAIAERRAHELDERQARAQAKAAECHVAVLRAQAKYDDLARQLEMWGGDDA